MTEERNDKTVTVSFSEAQHKNAISFLNRVNLTGAEVPAYMEIMTALMSGKKE